MTSGKIHNRLREGKAEVGSRFFYYRAKLKKWLPRDREAAIIDLGCGGGWFLAFLKAEGYKNIEGVDLSPSQVAAARARVPGVEVHKNDALVFLEDKKERYDCISALDLIEHLEKERIETFLKLVEKALKPGGVLILQTPNGASPFFGRVFYSDFTHQVGFTPLSLRGLLQGAGFHKIEFQETGPVVKGLVSGLRSLLWRVFSAGIDFFNLVETGTRGEGVNTRVLQCRAEKPGFNP